MRIVIISNNDWDGLWYQRQQFAVMYAERGHQVLFINKTLQRTPRIKDFIDRFFVKQSVTQIKPNKVPQNVSVKNIYTLPPYKWMNFANKQIVKSTLAATEWKNCDLLITYIPTYSALDIIEYVNPKRWAYINVHNYDADRVLSDLLKSEKIVCKNANFLFADSLFNIERLKRLSEGRRVLDSAPGVNAKQFMEAFRGDEKDQVHSICYFGGIGPHLDFEIYNKLAENYQVVFIGQFNNAEVKNKLSPKIEVIPPVTNHELPKLLQNMDVMGIFYKKTNYVNGVIPAKIYECVSTLKPVLTSGMDNVSVLGQTIYRCNINNVSEVLDNLRNTETKEVLAQREKMATDADWKKRFELLNKHMGIDA